MPTGRARAAGREGCRDVLVTRPSPGGERSCAALAAMGHAAWWAPMLAIEVRDLALGDGRGGGGGGWQAVLATSANAVGPLAAAGLAAVPLFAVGDATAVQASAAGFASVQSASGDWPRLAALCAARLDPAAGRLLLASGRGQGRALASGLRAAGFGVVRRVAYAQVPVRRWPEAAGAFLEQRPGGAVLFLSGSAARGFARVIPAALRPLLVGFEAIGISGAALGPVSRLPWKRLRVAVRPTSEDVLGLL